MPARVLAAFLILELPLMVLCPHAVAQLSPARTTVCDDLVPQPGALGYRARGRYCEGLYVQPVRSVLQLAALLAPTAQPAEAGQLAVIVPPAAAAGDHRLRVTARDPGVPYQLDASVPAGLFAWPAREVVEPVLGAAPALDAVAWTGRERPHYVPVAFVGAAPRAGTATAGARAAILSTVPVESYVARLVAPGGGVPFTRELRLRPAATRIELDLPGHLAPGSYELWLRVRLLGAGAPEQQSWLVRLP